MKENIAVLLAERNDLVEKFNKRKSYAVQGTQDRMDEICRQIDSLMTEDNSIEVTFLEYGVVRYTQSQIDELKAKGEYLFRYTKKADGMYDHTEKILKQGRVILSDDDEKNRFFLFCIGYHKYLDEYTPFYHIHDHYPCYPHKIQNSLDIYEGTYKNQFVDDFVYTTANGELAIKYGNKRVDSWNTAYDCVLTTSINANLFSNSPALISKNRKEVQRYEGNRWYHTNRMIGSYQ